MQAEHTKILEMLEQGKITSGEAAALLDALGPQPGRSSNRPPGDNHGGNDTRMPKYLFIKVQPSEGATDENLDRVDIRVPLAVLRAGVKLDAVLPDSAAARVGDVLDQRNVDFNLKGMDEAAINEFIAALADLEVDVVDGQHQVRVWAQ